MNTQRSIPILALVALLASVALLSWGAGANGAGELVGPNRPSVIASVDLMRINDLLDQIEEENQRLTIAVEQPQREVDDLKRQIAAKRADIKELELSEDERIRLQAEIVELEAIAKVRFEMHKALIDREQGRILAEAYKEIVETVHRMAQQQGYDMVIIDDHVRVDEADKLVEAEMPISEVNRRIIARPMLYASPMIDITEDVARVMNNEYRAAVRAGG